MNRNKYDIYDRIFKFVVCVLQILDKIPYSYSNQIFKNQLIRSVTSMGANAQEGDGAFTTKDFIHCFVIVRKEGKETSYWLQIIQATNSSLVLDLEQLIRESHEIVAIVSKIAKNTQKNPRIHIPIGHQTSDIGSSWHFYRKEAYVKRITWSSKFF